MTALVSGVARTIAKPAGVMSGTARADRSGVDTSITGGTVTVDYTAAAPWLVAGTKRTRGRVLIDGEDMTGLIGHITIDEQDDAISRIATFQVLDPRATFWHPQSLTRGGKSVEIYLACDDYETFSEELSFVGVTDSAPVEGPYCPIASFRCVSLAGALLSATTGCVQIPAFSRISWRDIVIAYALSAGIVLTLPDGVLTGTPQKPVNVSGVSVEEFIIRIARIHGLYVRESDDGSALEFKPWGSIGPEAGSFVDIDEDMYLGSPREDSPNRPVTLLTVSGSGISQASTGQQNPIETLDEHDDGFDSSGNPWSLDIWVTRWYGVEIKTVREDRKVYARLGVATETASLRLVNRQTTKTDYVMGRVYGPLGNLLEFVDGQWLNYFFVPTARTEKITDVTEGWFSPLESSSETDYLWSDNTHHVDDAEQFQETARTVTTFEYNAACRLSRQLAISQGWSTAKGDPGAFLYDDGTYRVEVHQYYREVKQTDQRFADNLAAVEAGATNTRTNSDTTATTTFLTTSWDAYAGQQWPVETYAVSEVKSIRQSGIVGSGSHAETTVTIVTGEKPTTVRKSNLAGDVPDPQVASETTPQFSEWPLSVILSAWTDLYAIVPDNQSNEDAETLEELENVARYLLRKSLAVRETITMPAIRGLRALHPVTLDAPERSLSVKQGHVEKLTRDFDTLNGWMGMQATVAISPEGL